MNERLQMRPKARNIVLPLLILVPLLAAGIWWRTGVDAKRARAAELRRSSTNLSQAHLAGLAAIEYADAHGGRLPDAAHWEQDLQSYFGKYGISATLAAPPNGTPRRLAMNSALGGMNINKLSDPANMVLFFESVSRAPSSADAVQSLPAAGTDGGEYFAICYADGHSYSHTDRWKSLLRNPQAGNLLGAGGM